jgi:type I restriction-modification system DNA methylase subunit
MKEALNQITDLVERFERNIDAYHSPAYNETQLRIEFIDPFFEALDWDVTNKAGYAEQYKDVIHEDAIKIAGATKAPDYCFRIGGVRKFFLETKKPSIDIKGQTSPAYQLKRYAWSAKLPISILTDFEETAIYDCRLRPKPSDKPSIGRVRFYTYTQYLDSFEEIYNLLSKESVLKGSFDKFAESERQKRGTAEVDAEFLKEIESWREALAKDIALKNPRLTVPELNFAVQLTIDRIIFLRMCEDRGIEHYGQIQNLLNGTNTYRRLREIFYHADDKYNSGLFDFKTDRLTPEIKVDDKPLKYIFRNLYYPESPYEFSVLGADILGHVYEQFLGKVIRLTEGHRAKVEEKPEVRKAGGVYYTPTYIIEYIVKNTVGKIVGAALRGRPDQGTHREVPLQHKLTPKQISKIRILDPACGSGSFLLGAYQYLLDYHRDWYQKDGPQKHTKEIYQGRGGQWYLTIQEKKRILLNNIYGVDIDPQAVEVTKLSLFLKVLEGENQDTLERQMKLFKERALPDLGSNIKCGNSLIGPDFYSVGAGLALPLFNKEEVYRINPFDWEKEFPEIMKQGGFDAVIGNPPYGAWFQTAEAAYFDQHYKVFGGVRDVYTCFIERGLGLLRRGGRLSYIVPSAWIGGPDYGRLRSVLLQYRIETLILLPFDVFPKAYVDTTIAVVSNEAPGSSHLIQTYVFGKREKLTRIELEEAQYKRVKQKDWQATEDHKFVLDPETLYLLRRLRVTCPHTLNDMVEMKRGVLFDKSLLTNKPISDQSHRYFEGDVYRYKINVIAKHWIEFGDKMRERPKEFFWFKGGRLLLRRLVNRRQRLMAALTEETFITNKNLYTVRIPDNKIDIRVLLGVLNSKLISFLYIKQVTQAVKDDFPQVTIKDILSLPFPSAIVIAEHAPRMVELVDQMLSLHKQLASAKTPDDKTRLQRQIDITDQQIDTLVYELYGLTGKEIRIIE